MDSRLTQPVISRFSLAKLQKGLHEASRRAIALARMGAPAEDFERARDLASKVRFFWRISKVAERIAELIERALRQLLASAPLQTMPLRAPRVVPVSDFSEPVGLTHAAHAPPAWRTTHSMR